MELRLGKRVLTLDRPRVMGVLNVTPDSFSDGGRYTSSEKALAHAQEM
jgi:dihydropteroate synthase